MPSINAISVDKLARLIGTPWPGSAEAMEAGDRMNAVAARTVGRVRMTGLLQ